MNTKILTATLLISAAALAPFQARADGDAANGAKLYPIKCGTCHALDTNKIGPMQRGVIGRKAGIAVGYTYSAGLKASGITWDKASLINGWSILPRWFPAPRCRSACPMRKSVPISSLISKPASKPKDTEHPQNEERV